jgi:hypothetical protein
MNKRTCCWPSRQKKEIGLPHLLPRTFCLASGRRPDGGSEGCEEGVEWSESLAGGANTYFRVASRILGENKVRGYNDQEVDRIGPRRQGHHSMCIQEQGAAVLHTRSGQGSRLMGACREMLPNHGCVSWHVLYFSLVVRRHLFSMPYSM